MGADTDEPRGDRSQAYTLEGTMAAAMVLMALLFGLQVVDPGPWTSDAAAETDELERQAQDVLDLAAEDGDLSRVVRCYGAGKSHFDGSDVEDLDDETTFERLLNRTFDERGRNYNVHIAYWDEGERKERLVSLNRTDTESQFISPSDSAAVATRSVTVYDDDPVLNTEDCRNSVSMNVSEYYDDSVDVEYLDHDVESDSPLYNVAEVRLVVW